MFESRKTEFSMYSGSKKQAPGSFTTETCFEFDFAWLVAMLIFYLCMYAGAIPSGIPLPSGRFPLPRDLRYAGS